MGADAKAHPTPTTEPNRTESSLIQVAFVVVAEVFYVNDVVGYLLSTVLRLGRLLHLQSQWRYICFGRQYRLQGDAVEGGGVFERFIAAHRRREVHVSEAAG